MPDGTTIGLDESPLISMVTSPELTNWLLAAIIIVTKSKTTPVNERTPKNKSICIYITYSEIPPNDINPKLIRPTIKNVIPKPWSPSGMSEYFSFSLIPAKTTIAIAQPTPAPSP